MSYGSWQIILSFPLYLPVPWDVADQIIATDQASYNTQSHGTDTEPKNPSAGPKVSHPIWSHRYWLRQRVNPCYSHTMVIISLYHYTMTAAQGNGVCPYLFTAVGRTIDKMYQLYRSARSVSLTRPLLPYAGLVSAHRADTSCPPSPNAGSCDPPGKRGEARKKRTWLTFKPQLTGSIEVDNGKIIRDVGWSRWTGKWGERTRKCPRFPENPFFSFLVQMSSFFLLYPSSSRSRSCPNRTSSRRYAPFALGGKNGRWEALGQNHGSSFELMVAILGQWLGVVGSLG